MGLMLILLALALLVGHVATVLFVYRDAQTRRTCPLFWLIAASLGGWIVAVTWLSLRERFTDLALETIMANQSLPDPEV